MITAIFRIVACGVPEQYTTSNGNQSQKRHLIIQEFGGYNANDNQAQRVSNGLVGTLFGNLALGEYHPNQLVVATLRFSTREYQGQWYQDITISDIQNLSV